jgi:hypothetical protein
MKMKVYKIEKTAQNAVIFIKKIPVANVMLRKHFSEQIDANVVSIIL